MDRKTVLNEINALYDARAALEAQVAGKPPVEQQLASKILQLIGSLNSAYLLMVEINERWTANGMTQRIVDAAEEGQTLAGYMPADWVAWGAITPRVIGFLNTEYTVQLPDGTVLTTTPKLALLHDYQPQMQDGEQ